MNDDELRAAETETGGDLYLVETGMYDVMGYGCVYILDADRPAIVETGIGTNVELILAALDELDISRSDVEVIAVTHVHLDHAGGAGYLAEACPAAAVVVHQIGAPHLVDPSRLVAGTKQAVGEQWQYYTDPIPVPEARVRAIEGGDEIDLGNHSLEAFHAPGHAPHQVVYYDDTTEAVFTGDAAGIWIPEREIAYQTSPPPNFDLGEAREDLETIQSLDPETLLFTHFGETRYREGILEDYGDRLSEWIDDVAAAAAEFDDLEAIVEQFVADSDLHEIWGERKAADEIRVNVKGALAYLEQELP